MSSVVNDGKLCAILMYIFPIGLIWYLVDEKMKANSFAKFHLKQSLVLLVAGIIASVALMIVGAIFVFIPIIGWVIIMIANAVVGLGFFIVWLIGLVSAVNGQEKKLPIIGQFGDKFTF